MRTDRTNGPVPAAHSRAVRVLHVTARYESGVRTVIDTIPQLTPTVEHLLLYRGSFTPPDSFAEVRRLRRGARNATLDLMRAMRDWKPDLIHAHSSHAGMLARSVPHRIPVIYQPHCFAFADPSRPRLTRALLRAVEATLARRTHTVAAVSPNEAELSRGLARRGQLEVVEVPNWTPLPAPIAFPGRMAKRVVMAGRIATQKDPDFFLATAAAARLLDDSLEFVWVGDGDVRSRRALEDGGVRVTGWLDATSVAKELAQSSVYVHTARYEGFPVSVLDAARLGLPVAARAIGAFEGLPLLVDTSPAQLAMRIVALHETEAGYEKARGESARILDFMNRTVAEQQLKILYLGGDR